VLFWVGLGLTIAVTVGLTLLARRRLREHMNSSQGAPRGGWEEEEGVEGRG
jgi:hypothetical protein